MRSSQVFFERGRGVRARTRMTTNLSSVTVITAALLSACSSEPVAEGAAIPPRFQPFAERLELELEELEIPGAAVAILQGGELAFARGFGTKGRFSSEPVDAETIFRTGSMGKVVTAMGILSAVD